MSFPILTSLVALPIVGSLLLLVLRDTEENERTIRGVALTVAGLVFAETLLLWARFNPMSADFQFVERHAWIPSFGISYAVGVDGISLLLVVLTGFLTPLALLSSWESVHKKTRAFCMAILLLESAMIGVFVSLDLFLFYVFWDAMLIPMYFIGVWGYDRRIYAAVKFIIYTMAGSVLMLLAILASRCCSPSHRQLQFRSAGALSAVDSAEPAVLVLRGVRARVCHQGSAVSVPHLAADAHIEAPLRVR
jgi:NADH-quinone oxidoreductase subunit M